MSNTPHPFDRSTKRTGRDDDFDGGWRQWKSWTSWGLWDQYSPSTRRLLSWSEIVFGVFLLGWGIILFFADWGRPGGPVETVFLGGVAITDGIISLRVERRVAEKKGETGPS